MRVFLYLVLACFMIASEQVKSDDECDYEVEKTLKTLLAPQSAPSIQLQALRNDLIHRIRQTLNEDTVLAAKRNVEALARAGYIRTLPDDASPADPETSNSSEEDANSKRSPPLTLDEKRGIEALARNGELPEKSLEQVLRDLYAKRFIGAMARGGQLPGGYFNAPSPKRNVASLARGGLLGKRNVAAMLRQDDYLNQQQGGGGGQAAGKRSLASVKAGGGRRKRASGLYENEEMVEPVYQNGDGDEYEELVRELDKVLYQSLPEKRFLGRLPQMGKPKTTQSPKTRFH